eukprot:145666_1
MGCCFGRKRDQNDDLLENEIDLESQEVVKPPTQSTPKHGSSSSLVPSKQIVLAVIGALLLLGVSIGGYAAWSKKRKAQRRFFRHAFDTTGVPSDAIQGVIRGAHNTFNDLRSDAGVGPQSSFPTKSRRPRAHHHNDSKQIQSTSAMGTDHPSSFAHQMQPYQGTGRHHLGMERKSAMPPPEGSPGFMALYGQNPQPQGTGHFYVDQLDLTRDDDDDDDY